MNAIKNARIESGLTRAEVARRLGMPYRTLEDWEKGASYPKPYIEKLIVREIKSFSEKK